MKEKTCSKCKGYIDIATTKWDSPLCNYCFDQFGPVGIFQNAINEVNNVLIEGEKTHFQDEWRTSDFAKEHLIMGHIDHAIPHLKAAKLTKSKRQFIEELSHSVTRGLMALQLVLEDT